MWEICFFFIVYIIWIISFLGFGSILISFLYNQYPQKIELIPGKMHILLYGFSGMLFVSTAAIIINFFFPVTMAVALILCGVGILFFVTNRKRIFCQYSRNELIAISLFGLMIFLVIPSFWTRYYDVGLYHLQAMKWVAESSQPFGLGNLYPGYRFNYSWYVLEGCVDQLVLILDRPYFLLNGICFFFYGSSIFLIISDTIYKINMNFKNSVKKINDGETNLLGIRCSELFFFLTFIPVITVFGVFLTSSSPDFIVILLTFIIIWLIIMDFEEARHINIISILAVIFSAYSLTIKLSAALLFVMSILLLFFRPLIENFRKEQKNNSNYFNRLFLYRTLFSQKSIIFVIILMAIIIPWVVRGLFSSGYIVYPLVLTRIPWLEWAVPTTYAISDANVIKAWMRMPGPDALSALTGWDWIVPWFIRNEPVFLELILICIVGIACGLLTLSSALNNNNNNNNRNRCISRQIHIIIPLIVASIGVVFWFINAPDPRVGLGFLFSFALLILSWGIIAFSHLELSKKSLVYYFLLLILLFAIFQGVYFNYGIIKKAESFSFDIPVVPMIEQKTSDGYTIFTPSAGEDQAWNAPLPNAPEFNKDLRFEYTKGNRLPTMFWISQKAS